MVWILLCGFVGFAKSELIFFMCSWDKIIVCLVGCKTLESYYYSCSWNWMDSCLLGLRIWILIIMCVLETRFFSAWVAKSGFLYNSCLRLDSCSWARNLIELLKKYGLRKTIITYVKGEGSNLNAMTIALNVYIKSIQVDLQKCIIWLKIWKG
jgi:hypothetical protein